MATGLNTEVEHGGRVYHVQTENTSRPGPAVETLIFDSGEILVRMTASYEELTARLRRADTDVRRALELQHWNLVRKVRAGMLDDEPARAAVTSDTTALPEAASSPYTDDGAEVRELLGELDDRLAEIFGDRQTVAAAEQPESPSREGRRRLPRRLSVVLRW